MTLRYALIDAARNTSIVEHYRFLKNSSYNAQTLREIQRNNLVKFLLHIQASNPYYSGLLGKVSNHELERHPYDVLESLPATDKHFMKLNRELLHDIPSRHREILKHTGGSTGDPFEYYLDTCSISHTWGFTLWCWDRLGYCMPGDPYITVASHSLGSSRKTLRNRAYHFLQNTYHLPVRNTEGKGFHVPRRFSNAKIILGYPSMLFELVANTRVIKDCFPDLRAVFTTSEQLLPGVRERLESGFCVPVYDMYGANDGGLISCEDRDHRGFHYNCINVVVERESESGEILLTNLNSWTFPFVRYRLGDVVDKVEQSGTDGLDNPFPRIIGLRGRTRDLVRLPSGRLIHGSLFNNIFFTFPWIARYRICQNKDYSLDVGILSAIGKSADLFSLNKAIEQLTSGQIEVRIHEVDSFSPSDEKEKLIVSHV